MDCICSVIALENNFLSLLECVVSAGTKSVKYVHTLRFWFRCVARDMSVRTEVWQ
jgi:hypothetical protein